MAELDDQAMFARFLNGDETMFAPLVQRYERPLYRFLVRYLGNATLAEDAFQETCLRVYRGARTFETGRAFRPWVYAIALNVARRVGAKEGREKAVCRSPEAADDSPAGDRRTPGVASPSSEAERRELGERIRRAVEGLPPTHREVFLLAEYEGLAYGEIAEAVGIPVGTVKSRMHYAVHALRDVLRDVME